MSIFTTPLSELAFADLDDLLQAPAVENVRLEFKSEIPDKSETLKKLSSFANTFGGLMVVGAKANSKDGRLVALPGVVPQNGYKQQVQQWCFDGANPPLIVEASDAILHPTETGKVFYVLSVLESDVAPHFLNGRQGIWVRADEFSQRIEPRLATEDELRYLLERRRLTVERRTQLVERSQRRFAEWRSRKPKEGEGNKSAPAVARLELSIGPRFPTRPVCEQVELAHTFQNSRVGWRQTQFPYGNAKFISQHESVLFLTPADARNRAGLVEANIWGMLFYGVELDVEIGPRQTSQLTEPITGIHLNRFVGYLLVFIEHARNLLDRWSYAGPLLISVGLNGVLGIPWLHSPDGLGIYYGPMSELDESFAFSVPTDSDTLRERPDALVMGLLQNVMFSMNWSAYAGDAAELERLVKKGYDYSSWDKPTKLRV